MISINEQSPKPLRLAGLFWKLLGSRPADNSSIQVWQYRFESLLEGSGLDFEEFRRLIKFALRENAFTAENLVVARDPMKSFEKQFPMIQRVYAAKLAGDRARERRTWKRGACLTCDEREAQDRNGDCEVCSANKLSAEFEELWDKLGSFGLIHEIERQGRTYFYVGENQEGAICAAPDSLEELKAYFRTLPEQKKQARNLVRHMENPEGIFEREDDLEADLG
jgi:hypothetical protein